MLTRGWLIGLGVSAVILISLSWLLIQSRGASDASLAEEKRRHWENSGHRRNDSRPHQMLPIPRTIAKPRHSQGSSN